MNINAATFTYFRSQDQQTEFIGRVFLLDPHQVDYNSDTKTSSKRRRKLSLEELEELADQNSVGQLYRDLVGELKHLFPHTPDTSLSSIRFLADFEERKALVAFSLLPRESSEEKGVSFIIYMPRFMACFGLDGAAALELLPDSREPYSYMQGGPTDLMGYRGFFKTEHDVGRFVDGLKAKR